MPIYGQHRLKTDWGYAPDYVKAMWMILQHENPSDYVIATGEMHTVREFIGKAFQMLEMPIQWKAVGLMKWESIKTVIKLS